MRYQQYKLRGVDNIKLKRVGFVIALLFIVWSIIAVIDYWQVCHNYEKPIFAIGSKLQEDGGSGLYKGIGYSVDIRGNFMPDMPEEEPQGVTNAKFYVFGNLIEEKSRN